MNLQTRYAALKEIVRTWWADRSKVGAALLEIRDSKLYKQEHDTFEAFCQAEYGIERSNAYRLIGFAEIKASIEMSQIGDKITNESQGRALAAVPEERRVEVVEETARTGPVTAKRITETAERVVAAKTPAVTDKTGYAIPESVLEDWRRAEAQKRLLQIVSELRVEVKEALDQKDPVWAEVTNTILADLNNVYTTLKCVMPYAVCTSCHGQQKAKCSLCRGRGFFSEFAWRSYVPIETKNMREAMRKNGNGTNA